MKKIIVERERIEEKKKSKTSKIKLYSVKIIDSLLDKAKKKLKMQIV